MWLLRFYKACDKYDFSFVLSTHCGLRLTLRPIDTYEDIELKEERYWDYNKLYKKAIKIMKEYRKPHKEKE